MVAKSAVALKPELFWTQGGMAVSSFGTLAARHNYNRLLLNVKANFTSIKFTLKVHKRRGHISVSGSKEDIRQQHTDSII